MVQSSPVQRKTFEWFGLGRQAGRKRYYGVQLPPIGAFMKTVGASSYPCD